MNVISRLHDRLADARLAPQHDDGQVLVEYALLVSLIVIVCVGVITTLGLTTSGLFSQVVQNWP
jgi:Flp pilus assembly pilin Flp